MISSRKKEIVLQNIEPSENTYKNKLKLPGTGDHHQSHYIPKYSNTKSNLHFKREMNDFFEKSKKYINSKLSLEFIVNQFYLIENIVKILVDYNIANELIYPSPQKIPFKVLDNWNVDRVDADSFQRSFGIKLEYKKESGINQSQSIMQIINEK